MPGPVLSTPPRGNTQPFPSVPSVPSAPSREQNTMAHTHVQDPTNNPIGPRNLNYQLDEMTDDLPHLVTTIGRNGNFMSRPL